MNFKKKISLIACCVLTLTLTACNSVQTNDSVSKNGGLTIEKLKTPQYIAGKY